MKVAYLGPNGSFTHTATMKAFPTADLIAMSTIPACIKAVEYQQADLAIVPIENTIEGTVNTTLDYLYHNSDLPIGAEIVLPISQQLMVHPEHAKDWVTMQKVMSHPQALAQSNSFLNAAFPSASIETTPSTAFAAQYVSEHPEEKIAAIAPAAAAETYGLAIVKRNIQDLEINKTRFWVLGAKDIELALPVVKRKMSISVTMPLNTPGALHKALSVFSWRQINLSKIESRPLKTILGEYFFLIDIVVEQPEQLIKNALEELAMLGGNVKIFGNYVIHSGESKSLND